jgi:N-acetylmuramoyl-L-alanine amidase
VAPGRKIDPGEKFDWSWLARQGVGHWVDPAPLDPSCAEHIPEDQTAAIVEAQTLLRRYGYAVEVNGELDRPTCTVIKAFQLHVRPQRADGNLDRPTFDTLSRLVAARPVPIAS